MIKTNNFVIDVSKYQGTIDWAAAKAAGVQGAILRAGYGRYASQIDHTYERNYAECKRLNIPVGAYWYVYAKDQAGIAAETSLFLQTLEGKQLELPVYLDVEDKAQAGMSKAALTDMVRTGCKALEAAGWFAGFYTYTSFAQKMDYAALAKEYTPWLADYRANYNTTLPRDMHQYSSGGSVPGIAGRVDCNHCYRDFAAEIIPAGLNGFAKKEDVKMQFKPVEDKQLRCTSAAKPKCEVFAAPSVDAAVLVTLELDQVCEVLEQGDAVALAGMQATWYKLGGFDTAAYCLALPDRCIVEDKPDPVPEPTPEPIENWQSVAVKLRAAMDGLPEGRAKSCAITKLDECEMWAARAAQK